ncbi:hypothetical protein CDAR_314061 [Caerostris darwini]|uniref:Uncharacterized protein n=1 Tax=Caerostris darwini TaxID=1538125 RepID=A0AAV4MXU7_9ARAC|nr:hypothetical protein CDAR_314061 [Caerostris darwini]
MIRSNESRTSRFRPVQFSAIDRMMPNTSKRELMNGSPVTQTDPILRSATHSSLPPPHSNWGIGSNEKPRKIHANFDECQPSSKPTTQTHRKRLREAPTPSSRSEPPQLKANKPLEGESHVCHEVFVRGNICLARASLSNAQTSYSSTRVAVQPAVQARLRLEDPLLSGGKRRLIMDP